jgi:ABC-type glutathione transport system ATPase component
MAEQKQLELIDLRVSYHSPNGQWRSVLTGVNLHLRAGETIGVLGPSGSGKSTLGLAAAGMLPINARITGGAISRPLVAGSQRSVTALIHQEPARVLSPVRRVGDQIADAVQARFGYDRAECKKITLEGLSAMQFEAPDNAYRAYPHELSGGQRQRIVIAQAFLLEPSLIVADEPTSALDSITQRAILKLMRRTLTQRPTAMILITHDPLILLDVVDRIAVLKDGRVVEENATERLWSQPRHPYTQRLLSLAHVQRPPSR